MQNQLETSQKQIEEEDTLYKQYVHCTVLYILYESLFTRLYVLTCRTLVSITPLTCFITSIITMFFAITDEIP